MDPTNDKRTAIVAGASGLVGTQVLQILLEDSDYRAVTALVRRPLTIKHSKLSQVMVDFMHLDQHKEAFKVDDVYCCLGTTMKQAKDKDIFQMVDVYFPKMLAVYSAEQNVKQFAVVSGLGANKHSKNFYFRIKGEMEEAVCRYTFQGLHIFQPSLILGKRKASRGGELALRLLFWIWPPFIFPNGRKKSAPVKAQHLAAVMVNTVKQNKKGVFVVNSPDINSVQNKIK